MTEEIQELEDRELELEALADALASLSHVEECPAGVTVREEFEPTDVAWEDNHWILRLLSVQGWLALDPPLDSKLAPKDLLDSMFSGIASTPEGSLFTLEDDSTYLTDEGIAVLRRRVDTAVRLKELFEELIDGGLNKKAASREWMEEWENESNDTAPPLGVNAEAQTWSITTFAGLAEEGELDLDPTYQRDVVWVDSESKELIDSILRGIPLPSIILNKRRDSEVYEIVDGKQRLTAILRFIGKHPRAIAYRDTTNVLADEDTPSFSENFRAWAKHTNNKSSLIRRENYLPFKTKSSLSESDPLKPLCNKYYHEIKSKKISIQGTDERISKTFESDASKYKVPVIVYEDTHVSQIQRVFGLYNKQGKKLNAEEIRNATFHNLGMARLIMAVSGDSERLSAEENYIHAIDEAYKNSPNEAMLPKTLNTLNIGTSRFKRSKLVGWVCSLLLYHPKDSSGRLKLLSTRQLIDGLLYAIEDDANYSRLKNGEVLSRLAGHIVGGAGLLAHFVREDSFAGEFISKAGKDDVRWEDLPTVAILTTFILANITGFEPSEDDSISNHLFDSTETLPPPDKQQRRTQWQYFGHTILTLLEVMGINREELGRKLEASFGYNCLTTLEQAQQLRVAT